PPGGQGRCLIALKNLQRVDRLADLQALVNPLLDPLQARDLMLRVEAMPARRACGEREVIAALPNAQRRFRDASHAGDGADIEDWLVFRREVWLRVFHNTFVTFSKHSI